MPGRRFITCTHCLCAFTHLCLPVCLFVWLAPWQILHVGSESLSDGLFLLQYKMSCYIKSNSQSTYTRRRLSRGRKGQKSRGTSRGTSRVPSILSKLWYCSGIFPEPGRANVRARSAHKQRHQLLVPSVMWLGVVISPNCRLLFFFLTLQSNMLH